MARSNGRVAVVTGGAQGLGLGIVRRLLDQGQRVAVVDVQERLRSEIEQELLPRGEWLYFSADVSNIDLIRKVEQGVIRAWGRVDELVNNAGIFPRHEAATMPLEQWEHVLRVNLTGTFICSQVFSQSMRANRRGAIVNTASGRAIQGAARGAHYAASKAGIINLTRTLALEWAPLGVRVNCVIPGVSDTAQPREDKTDEELYAMGQSIPLGRIGQPEDIAAAVSFLLSGAAGYITGQCLAVNGGAIMM